MWLRSCIFRSGAVLDKRNCMLLCNCKRYMQALINISCAYAHRCALNSIAYTLIDGYSFLALDYMYILQSIKQFYIPAPPMNYDLKLMTLIRNYHLCGWFACSVASFCLDTNHQGISLSIKSEY